MLQVVYGGSRKKGRDVTGTGSLKLFKALPTFSCIYIPGRTGTIGAWQVASSPGFLFSCSCLALNKDDDSKEGEMIMTVCYNDSMLVFS